MQIGLRLACSCSLCLLSTMAFAGVVKVVQQEHSKVNYVSYSTSCSDGSTHGIHQWFADRKFYNDQGQLIKHAYGLQEAADIVCKPATQ